MSRNQLTLLDKVKLIELKEKEKLPMKEIMSIFKCGKTQIYNAITNKEKIMRDYLSSSVSPDCKRIKSPEFEKIDVLCYEWFVNARAKNLPISGPILQAEALKIAEELDEKKFKASNGWLNKFKKRHNITWHHSSGEGLVEPTPKAIFSEREDGFRHLSGDVSENGLYDMVEVCYNASPSIKAEQPVNSDVTTKNDTNNLDSDTSNDEQNLRNYSTKNIAESTLAVKDFTAAILHLTELQKFSAFIGNDELLQLITKARECAERSSFSENQEK